MSVRTTAEGAQPSNTAILLGRPVPAPTAVYAHNTDAGYRFGQIQFSHFANTIYRISWAAPKLAPVGLSYKVVLSPDPEFINRTCQVTLPIKASPLVIHPSQVFISNKYDLYKYDLQVFNTSECDNQAFSVAVVAVTQEEFTSQYSRAGQSILPLTLLPPPGTITIPQVGNKYHFHF